MAKAVWNCAVLADSDKCQKVGSKIYFPPDAVNRQYLQNSDSHTECEYKGVASYYHVVVGGKVKEDAAWYYRKTKPDYQHIAGWIAFWNGVEVTGGCG